MRTKKLTCKVCGRKTDWDSSCGYREFLVCNACERSISNYLGEDYTPAMTFIFACGEIARKVKGESAA